MTDKHIFICSECRRIFKVEADRDTHMKKDHKDVPTEMTEPKRSYWLKSGAEESPEKRRTDEPQRNGKKYGPSSRPRRNSKRLKKRKKRRKSQQHRPKKRQNVLRAMTETMTKITSPQKNQAVRTHCTSQPKRSSEGLTRKATSELYFMYFPLQIIKLTIHVHSYFLCRF